MSPELIVAVFAGITSIITAVGAIIIALHTQRVVKDEGEKKDVKLDEIHYLVNSRLTEALEQIIALQTLVTNLTGASVSEVKSATFNKNLPNIKKK